MYKKRMSFKNTYYENLWKREGYKIKQKRGSAHLDYKSRDKANQLHNFPSTWLGQYLHTPRGCLPSILTPCTPSEPCQVGCRHKNTHKSPGVQECEMTSQLMQNRKYFTPVLTHSDHHTSTMSPATQVSLHPSAARSPAAEPSYNQASHSFGNQKQAEEMELNFVHV